MTGILSDQELADIRHDVALVACDKPCVLTRKSTTRGPAGEPIGTWATVATTVVGMRQPSANLLQNYSYAIGSLATWHLCFPSGTNPRHQDRVTIEGETLEIAILLTPQSYSTLDTALATELR